MTKKTLFALCLAAGVTLSSAAIPLSAEAAGENTNLYVVSYYDEDIKPQKGDIFSVSVKDINTGSEKQFTVDASEAQNEGQQISLESGSYQVTMVDYEGYNDKVEKSGYAITSTVVIEESEDSYSEMLLGVGGKESEKLQTQYGNVMVKQNEELVPSVSLEDTAEDSNEDTQLDKEVSNTDSNEEKTKDKKPILKEEDLITEVGKKEEPKAEESSIIKKIAPIGVIALIAFGALFIFHKKKKI